MRKEIKGNEGNYLIKNESVIVQFKINSQGKETGERIIHSITDTIENSEDRKHISKIIEEINFN